MHVTYGLMYKTIKRAKRIALHRRGKSAVRVENLPGDKAAGGCSGSDGSNGSNGSNGNDDSDATALTVSLKVPTDTATGVAINSTVTATFSKAIDSATLNDANFTLAADTTSVAGTVTYNADLKTASFAPESNLDGNTMYTATVTTGVTDEAGNALATNVVWTFTTTAAGLGPAPVNLGTAGNYVVLAKSTVTNDPTSEITGNIGLSPAATSFLTGFSHTLVGSSR